LSASCWEKGADRPTACTDVTYEGPATVFEGDTLIFKLANNDERYGHQGNVRSFAVNSGNSIFLGDNEDGSSYYAFIVKDVTGDITLKPEYYYRENTVAYNAYDGKGGEPSGASYVHATTTKTEGVIFNANPLPGYLVDEIYAEYSSTNGTKQLTGETYFKAYADFYSENVSSYWRSRAALSWDYSNAYVFTPGAVVPKDGAFNIYVKYKVNPNAVAVNLYRTAGLSYSATYAGIKYDVPSKVAGEDEAIVIYPQVDGNKSLTVELEVAEGYALDSIYMSYVNTSLKVTSDVKYPNDENTYSFVLPTSDKISDLAVLAGMAKFVQIVPFTSPYVNVTFDIAGKYKSFSILDSDGGEVCTGGMDGCAVVSNREYTIKIEEYDGHTLKTLSCEDGNDPTTLDCAGSKKFKPKSDFTVKAEFEASLYTVTADASFPVEILDREMNPITTANALDTILVAAKDADKVIYTISSSDVTISATNYYPANGDYHFFVMPAKNVKVSGTVGTAFKITVNGVEGKGEYSVTVLGANAKNVYTKTKFIPGMKYWLNVTPKNGYEIDKTSFGNCIVKPYTSIGTAATIVCYTQFEAEATEDRVFDLVFTPMEWKVADVKATKVVVEGVAKDQVVKTDEEVSFTVTPVSKYEIDFVKVVYEVVVPAEDEGEPTTNLVEVETSKTEKDGVYTYKFTAPAADVKIEAVAKEIQSSSSAAVVPSDDKSSSSAKAEDKSSSSAKAEDKSSSSAKAEDKSSSSAKAEDKSSSSAKAEDKSSSSVASSESKAEDKSSSSKKDDKDAIIASAKVPMFSLSVAGRNVQIAGATVGAKVAVFDMQGSLISTGRVDAANFSVAMPRSGSYMVRVGSQTQRVNVK